MCTKVALLGAGTRLLQVFWVLRRSAGIGDLHTILHGAQRPGMLSSYSDDCWLSRSVSCTKKKEPVSLQALCFLVGADLNQRLVRGGTFQEVPNKYFQGTLKGHTELHLSYFREPQAGRHLGRPVSPFLYGEVKPFMGINLI